MDTILSLKHMFCRKYNICLFSLLFQVPILLLTNLCSHFFSPGLFQSFRGLCSANELVCGSQISSIISPPNLFSTFLHPTPCLGAWTGWSTLTGALPSGFQMKLFFSVYFSVSFWFLGSCHLFSLSGLIAVTGLLLRGPGFCTLHCAHILVITPFVNNPSQITIVWRYQPFPAVIQS